MPATPLDLSAPKIVLYHAGPDTFTFGEEAYLDVRVTDNIGVAYQNFENGLNLIDTYFAGERNIVVSAVDYAANTSDESYTYYVLTGTPDVENEYCESWGSYGSSGGQFRSPFNVAVDRGGNIYVVDNLNHRVQKFSKQGVYVCSWGELGAGLGRFNQPLGIDIDRHGYVYVADRFNHRIQKFTVDGAYVATWGGQGSGPGEFLEPQDVAVDFSGRVYVTDSQNHRIQKFTDDGAFVAEWGAFGELGGEFNLPLHVTAEEDGIVYVTDYFNDRVQKFSASGEFLASWGYTGDELGQLRGPVGIAIGYQGAIYVTEGLNDRVQVFQRDGTPMTTWGALGSGPGQFDGPRGIACSDGIVYVVDKGNSRVQRFARECSLDFFCAELPVIPVAWWPGELDASDVVGDNDGVITGGTAIVDEGWVNGAFYLDGDGAIAFGDVLDNVIAGPDKAFTFSQWIYINEYQDSFACLVSKHGDNSFGFDDERQMYLGIRFEGQVEFAAEFFGGRPIEARVYRTDDFLLEAAWYHLAMVYEGGLDSNDGADRVKFFANGNEMSSTLFWAGGELGDITDGTAQFAIGAAVASDGREGYFFNGMIDELSVFDYALPDDEIEAIYSAGRAGACREGVSAVIDPTDIPKVAGLVGIYPNPFNAMTTIDFGIARRGEVLITVYDMLGRKVVTLIDEVMPAGPHTLHWNGRDDTDHAVASGVYFCRFVAGGFEETRKMALIK